MFLRATTRYLPKSNSPTANDFAFVAFEDSNGISDSVQNFRFQALEFAVLLSNMRPAFIG